MFNRFRIHLKYFGTNEIGSIKGWSSLTDYTMLNKPKFGLINVNSKKKSLKIAVDEADEAFDKEDN